MIRAASWILTLGLLTGCAAPTGEDAGPPQTDIWQVELRDGAVGTPTNLTDRDGYDNQPAFLPDGSAFLYTSHDGSQVDVWRYRFADGQRQNLTRTPESEYSPTPIPDSDAFSVVRVEDDGDRRVWRFEDDADEARGGTPSLIIEWEEEVEYHAWIDPGIIVVRVAGTPNELNFADPEIGWVEDKPFARSVGRTFGRAPGNNAFTFVHLVSPAEWWVRQVDLLTRETLSVVQTVPGVQDFAWTPDGALLMADGATLYRYRPLFDEDWVAIADLSEHGIEAITRLAVDPSGTRLLFVASRPAPASAEEPAEGA